MVREYAQAGVDYTKIEPFKHAMVEVGKKTLAFPNRRGVFINEGVLHAHGAVYEYRGGLPHIWCNTQEGLGNKNWIAEWMYQYAGTGRTYYEGIGIDTALMAVNDVIAQGAMPVVYTDEVWQPGIVNGLRMKKEARIWLLDISEYARWLVWPCLLVSRQHCAI
jgi:phosphoribosylaminoimidazole (AIR) synthetase